MASMTPTTPDAATVPPTGRFWQDQAACLDVDPELFFPNGRPGPLAGHVTAQVAEAKAVCTRCPVRAACLAWATSTGQRYGIWGGLTEQEREELTRREARRRRRERSAA